MMLHRAITINWQRNWFKICYCVFEGKTENFRGALGCGEEEAPGRKEEAAQRG